MLAFDTYRASSYVTMVGYRLSAKTFGTKYALCGANRNRLVVPQKPLIPTGGSMEISLPTHSSALIA